MKSHLSIPFRFALAAGCAATLCLAMLHAQTTTTPQQGEQKQRGPGKGGGDRKGDKGGKGGGGNAGKGGGHGSTTFNTDVPAHPIDFVLGRPTKTSITLNVLAHQDMEGFVAYGTEKGRYTSETPKQTFKQGQPIELLMSSLQPNTGCYYQFRARAPGAAQFNNGEEKTFHTARPAGSTFTFVVQADPHLDENVIPERYQRSMLNMVADRPDFLIDLGDTFMTGKYRDERAKAEKQYLAQRYYFGIIGQVAPVYLVLGNHDGEGLGRGRRSEGGGLAPNVWANLTRKKYFSCPEPNDFYTGNSKPHPAAGLMQDYYAWEWGNALFVTLDTFWFGEDPHDTGDIWSRTLGRDQYDWLKRTLESSRATFKFIFTHHLAGGVNPDGRGGAEASVYYEWGGKNKDGTEGFAKNRPGWAAPIHDLLVANGVSIVFHGHDHLFAKQDRDGIVYQCVPQPGNRGNGTAPRNAAEYSYVSGKLLGSPGYMRVMVTPDKVKADLVRSYQPGTETANQKNGQVDFSYTIVAGGKQLPTGTPAR